MGVLREFVRLTARRAGVEIQRWPQSDPLWRLTQLLATHRVDVILDVGANDGDYARAVRRHGYDGRIVSFEPVFDACCRLETSAVADPRWDTIHVALGAENQDVVINVAGNDATSSSILPMLDRHLESAPASAYIRTEDVHQRRLDDILPDLGVGSADRTFLKLDVQGYEDAVLDGAVRLLASDQLVGLETELSLTPLYEGGVDWRQAVDRIISGGFTLMSLDPGWTDFSSGQMLQVEAVFFRE